MPRCLCEAAGPPQRASGLEALGGHVRVVAAGRAGAKKVREPGLGSERAEGRLCNGRGVLGEGSESGRDLLGGGPGARPAHLRHGAAAAARQARAADGREPKGVPAPVQVRLPSHPTRAGPAAGGLAKDCLIARLVLAVSAARASVPTPDSAVPNACVHLPAVA